MSLALAVYYATLQGAQALPISGTSSEELTASPSPPIVRTKTTIIWSCLVTIFSCTWLAVHPNIPGPDASRWATFLRRVRLMIVAMIAPEAVILWAMRQWISAYKLGKKYESYGWTQSHGYFAIMGGFMIFKGDKEHQIVIPEELGELLGNGAIRITEKEILDKGRGDALSKGLILVQTTWFILQCIARRIDGLPITELELVTLAFAALNFVTYAVWWNKPLNVECAMRVYKRGAEDKVEIDAGAGGTGDAGIDHWQGGSEVWSMIATDVRTAKTRAKAAMVQASSAIVHKTHGLMLKGPSAMGHALQAYISEYRWHVIWHPFAALLSAALAALFALFYVSVISIRLGGGANLLDDDNDDDDIIQEGAKRVPTFHAGQLTEQENILATTAAYVIAMIFGGIHCVAWSFEFPSHTEQLLWRIASISITSAPVLALVLTLVRYWAERVFPRWLAVILGMITVTGSAIYITGRIVLLVLPFMSLRSLPVEAYQTVQWTTFIPHV